MDWTGTLRYMAAHRTDIPRCSMFLTFLCIFWLFEECDRDPEACPGFQALRPDRTCESELSLVVKSSGHIFEQLSISSTLTTASTLSVRYLSILLRLSHLTGLLGARTCQQTSPTRWSRIRNLNSRFPIWTFESLKVAYFLKKYGDGSWKGKDGGAAVTDNRVDDGQMAKEEEEKKLMVGDEEEEKRKVVAGDEEGMVEEMIGDYESQQEVFRKMRSSNPPSTA